MAETLLDVFVTGTDDGVGKTYVCALLAARARDAGPDARDADRRTGRR